MADTIKSASIAGVLKVDTDLDELSLEVEAAKLVEVATELRDNPLLSFEQLSDVCGIDYLTYGQDEWETGGSGYSRGVSGASVGRMSFGDETKAFESDKPRFAVAYQLLSLKHNVRVRLKVYAQDNEFPVVPSVTSVWSSAEWAEREAFDLFGIHFDGHDDLRRLLTDYGFVGHPFRKDFPLVGNVEMRYDPKRKRVIYEPVTIEPRVLVPRVIRKTSRRVSSEQPENQDSTADGSVSEEQQDA